MLPLIAALGGFVSLLATNDYGLRTAAEGGYVWAPGTDELLQQQTPTATYYSHENSIGSVCALTDSIGTVVERYQYDPFGNTTVTLNGNTGNRYRFHAMYDDPETDLRHTQNRAYNPRLGRWMQRDPIGRSEWINAGNMLAFVGNDPLNRIDPLGLWNWETIKSAFSISFGVGPSLGAKAKVLGLEVKAAVGAKSVGTYSTGEGLTVKTEAQLGASGKIGKYRAQIGPSAEHKTVKGGKALDCPETQVEWVGSVGRDVGDAGVEGSMWSIGASVDVLVASVGASVDLATLWEGIWE